MERNQLEEYRQKLSELTEEEWVERNKYLKDLSVGTIEGPPTGFPSIDKPWLKDYETSSIEKTIPNTTIYEHMFECNKNNMEDIALTYYGYSETFRELKDKIDKTARALVAMGVKSGDIITLTIPTLPETIHLFYAINKIGGVVNFIDPRTNEERMRNFINGTNSKIIFTIDKYFDVVSKAINGTAVEKGIVVSASNSLPITLKALYKIKNFKDNKISDNRFISYKEFMKNAQNEKGDIATSYKSNSSVAITYTGGTTGTPKGVVLTNEALVAQSINMGTAFFIENKGRGANFLNIMPPWLAYGVSCAMSSVLCMGMKVDIIPQFDYKKFDDLILKHRPEVILGVPTFFEELIKSPKLVGKDLSFLKAIIVGGSPLNVGTEEKINAFLQEHNAKIKITKGYGMSEMCAVATYSSHDDINSLGSVGVPLVKNNIAVVNPSTGELLGYDEVGELYLSGPTMMKEYLNNPEETENVKCVMDGKEWIKSKDVGYISANGEIFYQTRIKQMMIYEGHNVFAEPIEDVLTKHPAVSQVAVVGIVHDDSTNCEVPTAFVKLYNDCMEEHAKILEELRELCFKNLPQRDIAQDYYIIDEIPCTSMGKPDKERLKAEQTIIINRSENGMKLSRKK